MNMDATIDRLVDTCERNWVEKQALGLVGSKLTASALLALAGGAAGAGAGYMFDRGRVDPDESPRARARKMKQRMIRGAGIGAAAGGAYGLLMGADGPRPLEPHEKADAIKARLGPAFSGGAAQEATVRELSGQPVETGFFRQTGRILWDARPEFLGGTHMNNAAELAGAAAWPAWYMSGMGGPHDIIRRTGAINTWDALGGAPANPLSAARQLMRYGGIPTSANYQDIMSRARIPGRNAAGAANHMGGAERQIARIHILRELVRRNGAPAGATRLPVASNITPRSAPMSSYGDLERFYMRSLPLRQRLKLLTGRLGPREADAISDVVGAQRVSSMHAAQAFGKSTRPGSAPGSLVVGRRLLFRAVVSHYLTRVLNNAIMNRRARSLARDVADKLVAR